MESFPELFSAAAAKAALILALAGLVTVVWRSASASARHLVWVVAVASALVVPLAGLCISIVGGPRIPVGIWNPVVTVTADITPAPADDEPLVSSVTELKQDPVALVSPAPAYLAPAGMQSDHAEATQISTETSARMSLSTLVGLIAPSFGGGFLSSWSEVAVAVWLAGAIVALLPLLVAMASLRIVSSGTRQVRDERWMRVIRETPEIRHLAGRVRIVESDDASMPMTWGLLTPTLLVPSNASGWPDWKCRNILLHELAHVERRDCLTQLIAQIACAVYWFNPLAWVAAARMRVERELACDDRVLSAGSMPSDYASNLLDVAHSLRAPSLTSQTAIAMARPSQLSGRLLAVLDAHRNRRSVTRGTFAVVAVVAVSVVLPLALVEPARALPPVPAAIVRAAHVPAAVVTAPAPASVTERPAPPLAKTARIPERPAAELPLPEQEVVAFEPSVGCWDREREGKGTNVSINTDDSKSRPSWTVRYSSDDCLLELRAEGKFVIRPDLSDLQSLSSDGWFRLEEREGRETRRLDIRPASNGSLEYSYFVNGERSPFNAPARAWLAQTLLAVERRTAFAASSRVPQLYRSGGVRGVLSEISRMPSTHGKSRYYTVLLEMEGQLDAPTLNEIVRHASNDLASSDHYMTEVLGKLGQHRSANEATWRAFAEAAGKMKSDHYKSVLLKRVLASGRLSGETVGVLLRSTSTMSSDHYQTELLKAVAARYALNDQTRIYYAEALGRIKSDHYKTELLRSMDSDDRWDARTAAFVLASVSGIKSDHYRSVALKSLLKSNHVTDWRSFFEATAGMGSDHYKKETLRAVLAGTELNRPIVAGVISVAERMKSDYETAEVLSAVARSYRIDDQLRPAYERAVESIGSDHYRGVALSALLRSASR